MGLLLHHSHILEEQVPACKLNFLPALAAIRGLCPVNQGPRSVVIILGHAHNRNIKSRGFNNLKGRSNVPLSSIHENNVRENCEFLVSLEHPEESSGQNLTHGGIVILPRDGSYSELPVAASVGFQPFVNHHCTNGINAVCIGDIVGFGSEFPSVVCTLCHPHSFQNGPDFLTQGFLSLAFRLCTGIDCYRKLPGILNCQLQQGFLFSPFGFDDFHTVSGIIA